MKTLTVTEEVEIILDGKKYLLEKGDKIMINEAIEIIKNDRPDDRTYGHLHVKTEQGEYSLIYGLSDEPEEGDSVASWYVIYKGRKIEGLIDWADWVAKKPEDVEKWFDDHHDGLEAEIAGEAPTDAAMMKLAVADRNIRSEVNFDEVMAAAKKFGGREVSPDPKVLAFTFSRFSDGRGAFEKWLDTKGIPHRMWGNAVAISLYDVPTVSEGLKVDGHQTYRAANYDGATEILDQLDISYDEVKKRQYAFLFIKAGKSVAMYSPVHGSLTVLNVPEDYVPSPEWGETE